MARHNIYGKHHMMSDNAGKMPAPAHAVAQAPTLWARWKRLAHRAAEIQAHVLLVLLYVIVVIPMGLIRRVAVRDSPASGWQKRPAPADTAAEPSSEAELNMRI